MTSPRRLRLSVVLGLLLLAGAPLAATLETNAQAPSASARASRGRRARPAAVVVRHGLAEGQGGAPRFFVRTSAPVETSTRASARRFELLLRGTRAPVRNDRRPLETRFFNTPVLRIRVEPRGADLAVVFDLRAEATPNVRTEADGQGQVVYVDFPPGEYLTPRDREELATTGGGAGQGESRVSVRLSDANPNGPSGPAPSNAARPSEPAPSSPSRSNAPGTDTERPPGLGGR